MHAACLLKVRDLQRISPSALVMLLSTGPYCHACFEPRSLRFIGGRKVLHFERLGTAVAAARHSAVATFSGTETLTSTALSITPANSECTRYNRAAALAPQSSQSADGFLASPATSFTSLGLSQIVAEALQAAGFARPASVQVFLQ